MANVIIIGGGQAGLALGQALCRRDVPFHILDAAPFIGHAWRRRWDSLRLFTPAWYTQLPGMPFTAPPDSYPGKDAVADYLAAYAAAFALPVRLDSLVKRVTRLDEDYIVQTSKETYQASQVVVATGPYQQPFVPSVARRLAPTVMQLHSSSYQNPQQLPPGEVLVVGAGATGVQLAQELAATHRVTLAVGRRLQPIPQQIAGKDLFWWQQRLGLLDVAVDSPLGRVLQPQEPLIGYSLGRLKRQHGVALVGRVQNARDHTVTLAGGETREVQTVVWATGYAPSYGWIDVPVFGPDGLPQYQRGVTAVPGLYFLGLRWQYTSGSALLGGVGRDAAFLADQISARAREINKPLKPVLLGNQE